MQMNSEKTLASRLRSISRLNLFGLGVLVTGFLIQLGNTTQFAATLPKLEWYVAAVGAGVMLLANLLHRRTVKRINSNSSDPAPREPHQGEAKSGQQSNQNGENNIGDHKVTFANFTHEDRRVAMAIMYLSQFSIFYDDFFKVINQIDRPYLEPMSDSNDGRKRFYDKDLNAAITIGVDACTIQILDVDLERFASLIETALTVTGGSASIEKVKPSLYSGQLIKEKEVFYINVGVDTVGGRPMLEASLWRRNRA